MFTETISGKIHAAKTLYLFSRLLTNWNEVWRSYRNSESLPPLRFRRGFTLYHTSFDNPVILINEIFSSRPYRKYFDGTGYACVVDIGANIGVATLDMLSQSRKIRVYAYEPNPTTFETLKRNVMENGFGSRAELHPQAVGSGSGNLEMWTDLPSDWATATRFAGAAPDYGTRRSVNARKVTVPMVGLDTVLDQVAESRVDLLKIDAEGSEGEILEGATPESLRKVSHVVLEFHENLCPGVLKRCEAALERAGFNCRAENYPSSTNGILYAQRSQA